jgi:hypothetical protein
MFHCKNYVCQLISGCVCDCDNCYQAKGLARVDPVCPECGYCKHCGRSNKPDPNPWNWLQPNVLPNVFPNVYPQGPFPATWPSTITIGGLSGWGVNNLDYLQDLKSSSHSS